MVSRLCVTKPHSSAIDASGRAVSSSRRQARSTRLVSTNIRGVVPEVTRNARVKWAGLRPARLASAPVASFRCRLVSTNTWTRASAAGESPPRACARGRRPGSASHPRTRAACASESRHAASRKA